MVKIDLKKELKHLYTVSYAIKFEAKKAGNDFTVMPPEEWFSAQIMHIGFQILSPCRQIGINP
jgi:hypothetical protein